MFGSSVALAGNASTAGSTALIGGPANGNQSNGSHEGVAWVYTLSGATWSEQQQLTPSMDSGGVPPAWGSSVALSSNGNTALVGGPQDYSSEGAVAVYTRSGSTWSNQYIVAPPSDESNSTAGSSFGASVSLSADGSTALIGGQNDGFTNAGATPGAAWIYTLAGSTWSEGQKMVPSDESSGRV
jgi:hypothetical protein